MTLKALTRPARISVNRSELRQRQSSVLKKVSGRTVVLVSDRGQGREKYLVDKAYFDQLLGKLKATVETLEIALDPKLYPQILAAAKTLDRDVTLARLHTMEEAFGEN